MKSFFNSQKGFTLIELLVVVTIIAVLSGVGLVSFQSTSRNARNARRATDMENVKSALVLYRADMGSYPNYGGAASEANFDNAIGDLFTDGYFSENTLSDPQDQSPHVYTYTSDGSTFTVCAQEEDDAGGATPYCVNNP